ncbi:TPA: glycosyltransferase [Serratia fonticola]|jgi:glycosyltransferase involved in cell wall biosynthesis
MKKTNSLGVICNNRMLTDSNGTFWVSKQTYGDAFWSRYLTIFSVVRPICRVTTVEVIPAGWVPITLKDVKPIAITGFEGINQLIKNSHRIRAELTKAIVSVDSLIVRGPTVLTSVIQDKFLNKNFLYGVEVVSDPWDDFAKGSYKHKLRFFLQHYYYHMFKLLIKNAYVASYVTESYLQNKYPALRSQYSTNYSSISLRVDDISKSSCRQFPNNEVWHIGLIARLDTPHKGGDILLRAIKECHLAGKKVKCTIVGDGKELSILKELAEQLNINKLVEFPGAVANKDDVFSYLDSFDLFALPTRQEGLPRSIIEAMARGLPCLSTPIGGVPELVAENELFQLDNYLQLSQKIINLIDNPEYCKELSNENINKSKKYIEPELELRRNTLYSTLLSGNNLSQ